MAPTEHDAIRQIGEEVTATRELMAEMLADFRVLKTKLLGDDKEELSTGRIPLIEAKVKQLEDRQDHHARIVWIATGFGLCLNGLAWLLGFFSHLKGVLKP